MRAMFSVVGADGHFLPMVPLARAAAAAGHEVVFVATTPYDAVVAARGFRCIGVDAPWDLSDPDLIAAVAALTGADRLRYTLSRFMDVAVAVARRIVDVAASEQPQVLVRETSGWGGWLAGELLDVPVATFDFAPQPAGLYARFAGDLFNRARAEVGLAPEPDLASLDRFLTIVGAPPGWFPPECIRSTTHVLQPPEDPADTPPPAWLDQLPGGPTVYVTMGTVFNQTPGVFDDVLRAVDVLDANVVVTIGRNVDPACLPPTRDHVRIEPFIPQAHVLSRCDAVIAHGGYGSVMGALRRGRPMVTIPLAAGDNAFSSRRVAELGAGIAIAESDRSPTAYRDAAIEVLTDGRYRAAAEGVARSIAALPPFTEAVGLLERLASERRPLTTG